MRALRPTRSLLLRWRSWRDDVGRKRYAVGVPIPTRLEYGVATRVKPAWSWLQVWVTSLIHFVVSCVIIAGQFRGEPETPLARSMLLPLYVVIDLVIPGMQEVPGPGLMLLILFGVPVNSFVYGLFMAAIVFAGNCVWRPRRS